jgi:hypothetical protein
MQTLLMVLLMLMDGSDGCSSASCSNVDATDMESLRSPHPNSQHCACRSDPHRTDPSCPRHTHRDRHRQRKRHRQARTDPQAQTQTQTQTPTHTSLTPNTHTTDGILVVVSDHDRSLRAGGAVDGGAADGAVAFDPVEPGLEHHMTSRCEIGDTTDGVQQHVRDCSDNPRRQTMVCSARAGRMHSQEKPRPFIFYTAIARIDLRQLVLGTRDKRQSVLDTTRKCDR